MESVDIAVIGGGAAGLAAAIFAAEENRSLRVEVFDSADKLGKKILISGGGRCNVTHDVVTPADFNGSTNIVRNVLAGFDVGATVAWFSSLGVDLVREDTGKLFPVSNRAATVVNALLDRCVDLGIRVRTRFRVSSLARDSADRGGFAVGGDRGKVFAGRVVVATGGRSLPRTGSDGSGWALVRPLGHTVTAACPALVPLVLDGAMFHAELSGSSQPVELSTFADGKLVDRRAGSLLWTHFGISGPVVLDASRHFTIARGEGRSVELRCSFLPGKGFDAVDRWLVETAAERPRLSLARCLGRRIPERLAQRLAELARCDPTASLAQLTRAQRRAAVHAVTGLVLPVSRDRGWDFAEVTAGGVPLKEIDFRSMESRIVPGLYLVGEMLDCDGRIGGFNFQWAWSTGHIAGRAAARSQP